VGGPPLESYPGKSGIYSGKFESFRANLKIKTFCKDHNNPMRKKGKVLVKTFFVLESTLYIRKYFVLNIRADSSCPPSPQTVLLSYGYADTVKAYNHKIT